jgi:hypothetical protein
MLQNYKPALDCGVIKRKYTAVIQTADFLCLEEEIFKFIVKQCDDVMIDLFTQSEPQFWQTLNIESTLGINLRNEMASRNWKTKSKWLEDGTLMSQSTIKKLIGCMKEKEQSKIEDQEMKKLKYLTLGYD